MTFELPLTGEKVKPHQIIALHLMTGLVLAGAGAVLYARYTTFLAVGIVVSAIGIGLTLLAIFRSRWLVSDGVNRPARMAELAIALGLGVFSFMQGWMAPVIIFTILGITLLLSLFWEKGQEQNLIVRVDNEGIKLPATSRKKFIAWHEVEQVLLRFGTLTVNSRENHLYQWTVAPTGIDKNSFEDFCRLQIEQGKNSRPKNDW